MFNLTTTTIFIAALSLIVAVGAFTASAAKAFETKAAIAGIWQSHAVSNFPGNDVTRCTLQQTMSDGMIVRLSLNVQQKLTLSFAKNGWNSTIGDGQRIYLKVDNGPFYQVAAFVDERHMVHTVISLKGGLLRALSKGRILKILSDVATTSIEIGNVKQAIGVLEGCNGPMTDNRNKWLISRKGGPASTPKS